MAILAMLGHGRDARGTSRVGTSGAGPGPNAVRPYVGGATFLGLRRPGVILARLACAFLVRAHTCSLFIRHNLHH